jgi:hypothetical protein
MDQLANNRKSDLIRTIAGRVESRFQKNRRLAFWNVQDGILGIKVQNEILALCLGELNARYSKQWIAERLYKKLHGNLPFARGKKPTKAGERAAGLRRRWSSSSFKSWLTNNEMQPEAFDAQRVLDAFIDLAAENLVKHARELDSLKRDIRSANTLIYAMVHAIVTKTVIGDNAAWTARDGFVPRIASSLDRVPEAAAPGPLLKAAQRAVDYLAGIEGPRLVLLTGPAHSGKKTTIRYLISELNERHLRLADGTLLPTLALNLDELTPDEFVDEVFNFYRSGSYESFEVSIDEISGSMKVDHIRRMARKTPACVIFGEIGRVDADEIKRRVSGAYAEEIVSSLLEGHDLTRLILASHDTSTGSFQRHEALLSEYTDPIELPGRVAQSDVGKVLPIELDLSSNVLASGLSWRLCHTALHLAIRLTLAEAATQALKQSLKGYLERDDFRGLMGSIVDLLDDRQRLVVGMVCSSSDGLRFSVLVKMVDAFAALSPGAKDAECLTGGEVRGLLEGLQMLIQGRRRATDKVLVDLGALSFENVYMANESWRYLFLAEWWARAPAAGKLVMLLIAREAADQSRWLRVRAGARTPTSIGRDVQALHALIASADFSKEIADSEYDGPTCSESYILPPLDVHSPIPSARSVFRYSFRQLYTRDLEGGDFRLLNVAEDARTRLRILLTFMSPDTPWLLADEKPLSSSLSSYPHLTGALTPSEMVDLFASIGIAALRLQRFEVLSIVCRLGEQVFAQALDRAPLMLNLMRLLRAEIDAALLLGGNPDIYLEEKSRVAPDHSPLMAAASRMTIGDIVSRLKKLLEELFVHEGESEVPVDLLVARGKLHARLAEVLHAGGRLITAGKEFEKAIEIETQVMKRLPQGESPSPVLGGRGGRSYLAYNIDKARAETVEALWSTFIFIDELPIPISRRISLDKPDIARAFRCFELNARRLHNGRASEKVGIQIDGARLAVVDHQYARAFRLLDAANTTRFGPGSSLEILLELFAIQTRYLLDAAVVCLNANAKDAVFASEDSIAGLVDYFARPTMPTPLDLAALLLKRAEASHKTYRRLASLHRDVMTPHVTYVRYLGALHAAISSRMTPEPREPLETADFLLEGVLKHLELSAFLLYLEEAKQLKKGIETCLLRYR